MWSWRPPPLATMGRASSAAPRSAHWVLSCAQAIRKAKQGKGGVWGTTGRVSRYGGLEVEGVWGRDLGQGARGVIGVEHAGGAAASACHAVSGARAWGGSWWEVGDGRTSAI